VPAPKALALAAFGARGTGKTAWVKQQLARMAPHRLLIWDFKHDPALVDVGTPMASLPSLIAAAKSPTFRLRYLVDHTRDIHAQFDLFCQCAWLAGDLTLFVDELPEVTKANKAPPAWRRCVNVGRLYKGHDGKERSLTIIGAGQRPAECDKSFISNCDVIHTGRLANQADARDLAQSIGCDYKGLMTLPDLHWVEREAGKVNFSTGVLSFGNAKPAPKTSPKKSSLRAKI
jgi:hypothetical protein